MTIPQIADRLRQIASQTGNEELRSLASQLARRRPVRKAERVSQPMTDELADEIRSYAAEHPKTPQSLIALAFGLNQGRISEALRGKRS